MARSRKPAPGKGPGVFAGTQSAVWLHRLAKLSVVTCKTFPQTEEVCAHLRFKIGPSGGAVPSIQMTQSPQPTNVTGWLQIPYATERLGIELLAGDVLSHLPPDTQQRQRTWSGKAWLPHLEMGFSLRKKQSLALQAP